MRGAKTSRIPRPRARFLCETFAITAKLAFALSLGSCSSGERVERGQIPIDYHAMGWLDAETAAFVSYKDGLLYTWRAGSKPKSSSIKRLGGGYSCIGVDYVMLDERMYARSGEDGSFHEDRRAKTLMSATTNKGSVSGYSISGKCADNNRALGGDIWVYNYGGDFAVIFNRDFSNKIRLESARLGESVSMVIETDVFPACAEALPWSNSIYVTNCMASADGVPRGHVYEITPDLSVRSRVVPDGAWLGANTIVPWRSGFVAYGVSGGVPGRGGLWVSGDDMKFRPLDRSSYANVSISPDGCRLLAAKVGRRDVESIIVNLCQ